MRIAEFMTCYINQLGRYLDADEERALGPGFRTNSAARHFVSESFLLPIPSHWSEKIGTPKAISRRPYIYHRR